MIKGSNDKNNWEEYSFNHEINHSSFLISGNSKFNKIVNLYNNQFFQKIHFSYVNYHLLKMKNMCIFYFLIFSKIIQIF